MSNIGNLFENCSGKFLNKKIIVNSSLNGEEPDYFKKVFQKRIKSANASINFRPNDGMRELNELYTYNKNLYKNTSVVENIEAFKKNKLIVEEICKKNIKNENLLPNNVKICHVNNSNDQLPPKIPYYSYKPNKKEISILKNIKASKIVELNNISQDKSKPLRYFSAGNINNKLQSNICSNPNEIHGIYQNENRLRIKDKLLQKMKFEHKLHKLFIEKVMKKNLNKNQDINYYLNQNLLSRETRGGFDIVNYQSEKKAIEKHNNKIVEMQIIEKKIKKTNMEYKKMLSLKQLNENVIFELIV
jgi:hypothetical protein